MPLIRTTMRVSEAFPSQCLEAANLGGKQCQVTIARVEHRHGLKGKDGKVIDKPVVYFDGKRKPLVLNKTNAKIIRDKVGLGDDMDAWKGKQITIYPTTCDAFGVKGTPCIRVRPVPVGASADAPDIP